MDKLTHARSDEAAELLRPEDAARLLSIGRSKLYALLAAGELPTIRIGRSVRVPRRGLEAWIAQNTVSGTDEAVDRSR